MDATESEVGFIYKIDQSFKIYVQTGQVHLLQGEPRVNVNMKLSYKLFVIYLHIRTLKL